jgi:predicted flap endonuclease-1-like 5' DNA nuclease
VTSWLWWLVLGLLIGWLIEWVIDWVYWRRRRSALGAELAVARAGSDRLRADLGQARVELEYAEGEVAALRAENDDLRGALEAARRTATQPAPAPAELDALHKTLMGRWSQGRDALSEIGGIGAVYERRLFDAGIFTFADLAATTPQRIREIIQPERWQHIDPEAWIAEALVLDVRRRRLTS